MHPIDDKSPMFGITEKDLKEKDAEFVILIKSITDTYFQSLLANANGLFYTMRYNSNSNITIILSWFIF